MHYSYLVFSCMVQTAFFSSKGKKQVFYLNKKPAESQLRFVPHPFRLLKVFSRLLSQVCHLGQKPITLSFWVIPLRIWKCFSTTGMFSVPRTPRREQTSHFSEQLGRKLKVFLKHLKQFLLGSKWMITSVESSFETTH